MDTQQTEQIVKELNSFIKNLDRWATQLQTATVILPIISIIASLTVGFFTTELPSIALKGLALLSAFCSIGVSTFKLEKKARDMREAYLYLKHSMLKYVAGEDDIHKLIANYFIAEEKVGNVELDQVSLPKLAEVK
jgi:hypothetical protein